MKKTKWTFATCMENVTAKWVVKFSFYSFLFWFSILVCIYLFNQGISFLNSNCSSLYKCMSIVLVLYDFDMQATEVNSWFLSGSVNRYGEKSLDQQINFRLLFSHQIQRVLFSPSLYGINLVCLRVRGKWTHISPQKPFDYPFSFQCHVSPRGPNLMIDNPLRNLTTWLLTAGFLPAPPSIF